MAALLIEAIGCGRAGLDANDAPDASSQGADAAPSRPGSDASAPAPTADASDDREAGEVAVGICPASVPASGGACTPGLACEYGGDVHGACTTLAKCATESAATPLHWIVTPPAPGCGTNPPACASSFGAGEAAACTFGEPTCDYSQGRCGCVRCQNADGGALGGYWHCRPWSDVGAGCPNPRPHLGDACDAPAGTLCDYTQCCVGPSLGASMQCQGGYWRPYLSAGCDCLFHACP